jgi:hypothetical protein
VKKFLEALNNAPDIHHGGVPTNTQAEMTFLDMRRKFSKMLGKRALYTCKSLKDSRVVTIEGVTKNFVILSYNYYGMDYKGKVKTSVSYSSLISGEDKIGEVE